jgi:hypothetical protein
MMGGISEEGVRCARRLLRWKDDTDGLVLSGGEGTPGCCGIVIPSIGVTFPDKCSLGSATDGDCNGDCMETCLVFAEASSIRGGSNGVAAKASSFSLQVPFTFPVSIGVGVERSSRLS